MAEELNVTTITLTNKPGETALDVEIKHSPEVDVDTTPEDRPDAFAAYMVSRYLREELADEVVDPD